MCTTCNSEETPRTCLTCGVEIRESAPGLYECCYECAEEFGVRKATDYATGYEADDEARRRDAAVYRAMRQECSDPY